MTTPGRLDGVRSAAPQFGVSWFSTYWSSWPPSTSACSAVYPSFWAQVMSWLSPSRVGRSWLGLLVSSWPKMPAGALNFLVTGTHLLYRPVVIFGVLDDALKYSPSELVTYG